MTTGRYDGFTAEQLRRAARALRAMRDGFANQYDRDYCEVSADAYEKAAERVEQGLPPEPEPTVLEPRPRRR